jgi:hypothetical protein
MLALLHKEGRAEFTRMLQVLVATNNVLSRAQSEVPSTLTLS